MAGIKDNVAVIGMGCTRFGERWDCGLEDLLTEAITECCQDAGIDFQDIDAFWFGTFTNSTFGGLPFAQMMKPNYKPVTRIENLCATIESNDLEEPMVFEDLLVFACVGIESGDTDDCNTIKFGVGLHTPGKILAAALALTQMLDELFNCVKENYDPQTFDNFSSCYGAELNQMISSRDKRKTD